MDAVWGAVDLLRMLWDAVDAVRCCEMLWDAVDAVDAVLWDAVRCCGMLWMRWDVLWMYLHYLAY